MGKILDKVLGEGAGLIPGGKLYYKTLSKGISFINKVVKRKKEKAQSRKEEAEARLAQLGSLNFQGLQNAGIDTKETPAQKAVFGMQATNVKLSPMATEPVPIPLLTKDGFDIQRKFKMMDKMDWMKKNWLYLVGGAAVLLYVMRKKR